MVPPACLQADVVEDLQRTEVRVLRQPALGGRVRTLELVQVHVLLLPAAAVPLPALSGAAEEAAATAVGCRAFHTAAAAASGTAAAAAAIAAAAAAAAATSIGADCVCRYLLAAAEYSSAAAEYGPTAAEYGSAAAAGFPMNKTATIAVQPSVASSLFYKYKN
jgi:hypothetical protein